jgi:hypothetical protein
MLIVTLASEAPPWRSGRQRALRVHRRVTVTPAFASLGPRPGHSSRSEQPEVGYPAKVPLSEAGAPGGYRDATRVLPEEAAP